MSEYLVEGSLGVILLSFKTSHVGEANFFSVVILLVFFMGNVL